MKLKWRVQPAPTGRYRSFHDRGWPSADYAGTDNSAVMLQCEDDYVPADVKTGNHRPIDVYIAQYRTEAERKETGKSAYAWRKVKKQAATLKEAKALASEMLDYFPHFWPEEMRDMPSPGDPVEG